MVSKHQIQNVLMRPDEVGMHAIGRALVHLMNRQTTDEQASDATKYRNDRGFCPMDAKRGTYNARYYLKAGKLSPRQVAYWRVADKRGTPRICKYWEQLQEEAQLKRLRSLQNG